MATVLTGALLLLGALPVAADPVANISAQRATGDGVEFDVSVAGLAATDSMNPVVTVKLGGRDVAASTRVTDNSSLDAAEQRALVFALDVSGSMANGSLYSAKQAALEFIDELPEDMRIGVVAFGDAARVVAPLTTDRAVLRSAITKLTPQGDTALFDGALLSLDMLGRNGKRNVILLTDGEDTTSRAKLSDVMVAIGSRGIRVDAIRFNTSRSTTDVLDGIVSAGLGQLYSATDAETLLSVFRQATATESLGLTVAIANLPAGLSGRQPVSIQMDFDGERALVIGSVDLSAAPAPTSRTPGFSPFLLGMAFLLAASLFTLLMALLAGSARARRRRIEQVIAIRNQMLGLDAEAGAEDKTLLESLEEVVRPWIRRAGVEQKWTLMLDGAGLLLSAEQWLLIRIASVVLPPLVLAALFPGSLSMLVLAAITGYFAPPFLVQQRRKSKAREFESALPDMLLLVASSLRSGFSLEQAIVTAAEQSDGPTSAQMKRAIQELRIGLPLEVALSRVAERMASKDFQWVVTALQIQRKSGGNLSELLTTAARTVRERAEIRREVLTLTAEGRLSANVMLLMPFGLLGYLLLTQPDYISPLWNTSLGRLLSAVSAVMLALGWLSMRKLVQVDA